MRRIWSYITGDSEDPKYKLQHTPDDPILDRLSAAEQPCDQASHQASPTLLASLSLADSTPPAADSVQSPLRDREPQNATGRTQHDAFSNAVRTLDYYHAALTSRDKVPAHEDAIDALRVLAEVLVWADQNESTNWDLFMEHSVMALLIRCLIANNDILETAPTVPSPPPFPTPREHVVTAFQSQVLQTLSIVIQSVTKTHSHHCLFSNGHINTLIDFKFHTTEELQSYYITLLKTISQKLDASLLQFFFDPHTPRFPLYTAATALCNHPERMIRISARTTTLHVLAINDPRATAFTSSHPLGIADRLAHLCGSAARALEFVLDDGLEVARTRARTGLFRRRVREADVVARLSEVDTLTLHLADIYALAPPLATSVRDALSKRLFAPFFRPLATQALPPFDAAARIALLTFLLATLGDAPLARHAVGELLHPGRNVAHALKAIAADFTGTERASYIALRAVEAVVNAPAVTPDMLAVLTLDADAPKRPVMDEPVVAVDEPMLMTLTDFEAPLTPCVSLPSTPTYADGHPVSPTTEGDAEERIADALRRTPMKQGDADDEEDMLNAFCTGDASLRDVLMSVLLVVRRREARSLRVIQTIARIIADVAKRTDNWAAAIELSSVIVDEVASSLTEFINDRRTTIVSLEAAFTSYSTALPTLTQAVSNECELVFTSEHLTRTAALKPPSVGRVRRPMGYDYTPPIDMPDANVLFAMVRLYEDAQVAIGKGKNISDGIRMAFDTVDEKCSYLEKRDALNDLAAAALRTSGTATPRVR